MKTKQTWGPAPFTIKRTDGTVATISVMGRERWALENLIKEGSKGCTPIDHPGPRWSAYVHSLRHEFGVEIETIHEKHGEPFEGSHARYVLVSDVHPIVAVAA
jgi:hypothetical protein